MFANILDENFAYGDFIYSYYRFMELFHVRPESWNDLFEFYAYTGTQNKMEEYRISLMEQNNG